MKIQDRLILTIFTGTISAIIANTFGYLSKLVYPSTIIMPEIAAKSWVNASQLHTPAGVIFGNLCSFIAGGIHALVFILVLDFTGWRFFWLKSFAVSTTGWLIASITFLRILNLEPNALEDIWASILFYGAHFVYLSCSAFLVQRYGIVTSSQKAGNTDGNHNLLMKHTRYKIVLEPSKKREEKK